MSVGHEAGERASNAAHHRTSVEGRDALSAGVRQGSGLKIRAGSEGTVRAGSLQLPPSPYLSRIQSDC